MTAAEIALLRSLAETDSRHRGLARMDALATLGHHNGHDPARGDRTDVEGDETRLWHGPTVRAAGITS